jgi:hypothetical protein
MPPLKMQIPSLLYLLSGYSLYKGTRIRRKTLNLFLRILRDIGVDKKKDNDNPPHPLEGGRG